jgi:hypothetical protein
MSSWQIFIAGVIAGMFLLFGGSWAYFVWIEPWQKQREQDRQELADWREFEQTRQKIHRLGDSL